MQEKNILQMTMFYVGITILVVLFISIYTRDQINSLVLDYTGEVQIQDAQKSINDTTSLLLSLDKISFDTSILSLPYLQTLSSFPNFPIDALTVSNFGKANPFVGSFTVVTDAASASVGGIIYSGQRSLNSGEAVRAVAPARR